MEAPLDQETATADLVTDIIAPTLHRSSTDAEVCDIVRDLSSGTPAWRDAWSLNPDEDEPPEADQSPDC